MGIQFAHIIRIKSAHFFQGMSCEGAFADAHMRCAVARVRAKSILESVRDVRDCGPFLACDVRSHFCTLLHTFRDKKDSKKKNAPILFL